MSGSLKSCHLKLEPDDNQRLANLCGELDQNIRQIERYLGVEISNRGNSFKIIGESKSIDITSKVLKNIYEISGEGWVEPATIQLCLQDYDRLDQDLSSSFNPRFINIRSGGIKTRGQSQSFYVGKIEENDINFGVGPAGTGKTYLAVACAVEALEKELIKRLILVRPAVEAGERLGFLPGDLAQKIDPYLRPLYDALYEMLGFDRVAKLIEHNVIEIAPLAYMRGRSLNEAFVILDEAQNTTHEQMKMFLTRIGFGSKVVITGDLTQVDLPRDQPSGLRHAIEVLTDVNNISFTLFKPKDVIRHPLVQKIVEAYEVHEAVTSKNKEPRRGIKG